jgi:hypothetical protein
MILFFRLFCTYCQSKRMTSSGKVGEIFASAGEAFARENRFFPEFVPLCCVVEPEPVDP